ncbi:unnamed protein product, partial [Sphacelaria rigidula]
VDSLCLEAFVVALDQIARFDGGPWYTSTSNLQLVSLELCAACRRLPTAEVRANEHVPRLLWATTVVSTTATTTTATSTRGGTTALLPLRAAENQKPRRETCWVSNNLDGSDQTSVEEQRRSKIAAGTPRVPVLLAQSILWEFDEPPDTLLSAGANNETLGSSSLQRFTFAGDFNRCVCGVTWPATLLQLVFGFNFNQPISNVRWPKALRVLKFGTCFNQPIDGVQWPDSLIRLSFGRAHKRLTFAPKFNQPIQGVAWPASLERLDLGGSFNRPIVDVVWPKKLIRLTLGGYFNQAIDGVVWPETLRHLSFGEDFGQRGVDDDGVGGSVAVKWPASLRTLTVGNRTRAL